MRRYRSSCRPTCRSDSAARSLATVGGRPDIRPRWVTSSVAVTSGGRQSCSGMLPSRVLIVSPLAWQSRPSTVARPLVGGTRPSRILISVDLPAPLAPTSPVTPGATATVRPSSAVTFPGYTLVSAAVSTTAWPVDGGGMALTLPGSGRPRHRPQEGNPAPGGVRLQDDAAGLPGRLP